MQVQVEALDRDELILCIILYSVKLSPKLDWLLLLQAAMQHAACMQRKSLARSPARRWRPRSQAREESGPSASASSLQYFRLTYLYYYCWKSIRRAVFLRFFRKLLLRIQIWRDNPPMYRKCITRTPLDYAIWYEYVVR